MDFHKGWNRSVTRSFGAIFTLVVLTVVVSVSRAEYQPVDRIVAVVDKEIILESDVREEVAFQAIQRGIDPSKLKQRDIDEFATIALEILIRSKVLIYKAKKDTIEVDSEQVEEAVRFQMQQIKDADPNFRESLKAQNTSERELRNHYRKQFKEQFLAQKVQGRLGSEVNVTYRDVEAFRKTYRDSLPPQIGISHILIRPKAGGTRREEALKKIESLLERLKGGENFAVLAREFSEDPGSAQDGGDLGTFGKGKMMPEFETAAFALKPGEISEVVESPFGVHIIKCESNTGDQVRARHILILLKATEEDEEAAHELAEELKDRTSEGEDFAELARAHSDHETAKGGGFLNLYDRASPPAPFAELIPGMKLGEVGGPVKSEFGWHIFKIDDDRGMIENLLHRKKLLKLYEKTIQDLRQKMYVDVRI